MLRENLRRPCPNDLLGKSQQMCGDEMQQINCRRRLIVSIPLERLNHFIQVQFTIMTMLHCFTLSLESI